MALPANDTFTETEITALTDHTANSGHSWGGTDVGNFLIDANGELYAFGQVIATIQATPANADYYGEINGRTVGTLDTNFVGVTVRCNGGSVAEGTQTGYIARLDGTGVWTLEKRVAGVETGLDTDTLGGFAASTYYTLTLRATTEGSNVRVVLLIDSVEVANVVDSSSPITTTGNPGVFFRGDTTRITSFSAAAITGTETTINPGKATLTLDGRTPTTSAFTNVRIREVLVNGSGQAVSSASSIGLRVWYSGICAGAPDVSLNGMTTDASGTTSWSIATGTLVYNQAIFYVAQNSVSYSHYACGRLVPSYE
jgi:hypothetical protein